MRDFFLELIIIIIAGGTWRLALGTLVIIVAIIRRNWRVRAVGERIVGKGSVRGRLGGIEFMGNWLGLIIERLVYLMVVTFIY